MEIFRVPFGYGEAELIEKKSRFIGRVWLIENEAEAVARIKEMREKHWDATHNVYAYIVREGGIMRYSDDGEPQGTSGMPTLNVFRSEEIYNVCCVVTRYFGGTLLGTGGLVRAYSKTAKMALDAAGISEMRMWTTLLLPCDYSLFEKLKRNVESFSGIVEEVEYGAEIVLTLSFPGETVPNFMASVTEMTLGKVTAESVLITDESFRPMRIK